MVTFMFGNSVSDINFSFLEGVEAGHHETSHHSNEEKLLDQYEQITRWHVAQFAYLIEKLRSLPEGERNVLDNSAILFGSGFRDGNTHDHTTCRCCSPEGRRQAVAGPAHRLHARQSDGESAADDAAGRRRARDAFRRFDRPDRTIAGVTGFTCHCSAFLLGATGSASATCRTNGLHSMLESRFPTV